MTQKTIFGKDTDKIYNKLEEERIAEEARKAGEQRKQELKGTKPETLEQVITPEGAIYSPTLDLMIEATAPRQENRGKRSFRYDQSLARIKKAGYERHLRPWEIMQLITAYELGKLNPEEKKVLEDTTYRSEWVSMAIERTNYILFWCYLDPENLKWDHFENAYYKHDNHINEEMELKFSEKQRFLMSQNDFVMSQNERVYLDQYLSTGDRGKETKTGKFSLNVNLDFMTFPLAYRHFGLASQKYSASRGVRAKR